MRAITKDWASARAVAPHDEPERCASCRFWHSRDTVTGGCHRLAPRERDENTGQALWPLTSVGDSCGEWQLKGVDGA